MPTGQLGLAAMPEPLYSCTPSRLNAWLDCPRRYRMTYLDRPSPTKGPPWAHISLGVSVHNALADWWRGPRSRRTPAGAGDLLDAGWIGVGFRDDAHSKTWRGRARAMVERYLARLDPDDEPVGVERTVGAAVRGMALRGRVDRIDRRNDELVVVDYKTGRHPPTTDDVRGSLALATYAAASERTLRRRCRQVELHHLPSGRVVGWRHSDEALSRQLRRADALATEARAADRCWRDGAGPGLADEVFPARAGPQCGWCDFLRHCPVGRAVAAPRSPWDGLSDGQGIDPIG